MENGVRLEIPAAGMCLGAAHVPIQLPADGFAVL